MQDAVPAPKRAPASPKRPSCQLPAVCQATGEAQELKRCIETLCQVLAQEPVASYLSGGSEGTALEIWKAVLHLALSGLPARQCLWLHTPDYGAAAVCGWYPQQRLRTWGGVLRLMALAPLGRWRALKDCIWDLDRQKQAFYQSHGEFLYIQAFATAAGSRGQGHGTALMRHACAEADRLRKHVYAEAAGEGGRRWYRRHGFSELFSYSFRPNGPRLHIMTRQPR